MSVLDWLRKLLEPAPPPKPARAPRSGTSRPKKSSSRAGKHPGAASAPKGKAASARPAPWQPRTLPDDARWIGPNEQLEFQGLAIRGGLVYIGQRLAAGYAGNDPSLIDPTLPVAFASGTSPDPDLPAWPTYATLQPHQRGAYLRWLAGGRRHANVPIAYPFLYLYGIERRVLLEHASAQDRGELPAIRAELGALLATYGGMHEGFRVATERMIGLIDLQQVDRALVERARHGDATMPFSAATLPPPPPLMPANDVPPISLQIGLGLQVLARAPIDPAWALGWAWYAPNVAIRTPALRCQAELAALFAIRYREHYGDGIVLDPGGFERLVLQIQPANALLNVQTVRAQLLPDVLARSWFYRPLTTMIADLTGELDTYSRWLGRNPDRAGSLSAWAMLPEVLARPDAASVAPGAGRLAALIGAGSVAVVETDALLRIWVGERAPLPDRITRADATLLATALGRLGYGIEPDPRMGTALARGESVAIFRLPSAANPGSGDDPASRTPDSPFGQAMTLVHLAAIVGEVDGAASGTEFAAMRDHLRTRYPLSPQDERRLGARLAWLASRPAAERTLAGMKKAIAPLSPADRDRFAEGLLRIVDADGTVTPDEVMVLQKIWRLLGRDPDRVASDLHAVMTGGHLDPTPTIPEKSGQRARRAGAPSRAARPAGDEPVIVRAASPETPGIRIPPPPHRQPDATPTPAFDLDAASIARKLADTAAVSALLGDLLAEDASPPAPAPETPSAPASPDQPLPAVAVLEDLSAQDTWTPDAFAAMVKRHGLMPNAALDMLNELGFDHAGDAVLIESADGSLEVESDALATVLAAVRDVAAASDSV